MIYLVDYENVNLYGMTGIEKLKEEDQVVVFLGNTIGAIPFEWHIRISNAAAKVKYIKCGKVSKNYLDFQLATYCGYMIAGMDSGKVFIISKDKGYDSVVDFWTENKEEIQVSRVETIDESLGEPKKAAQDHEEGAEGAQQGHSQQRVRRSSQRGRGRRGYISRQRVNGRRSENLAETQEIEEKQESKEAQVTAAREVERVPEMLAQEEKKRQEMPVEEGRKASQMTAEERKDTQELSVEEVGNPQETSTGEDRKASQRMTEERKDTQELSAEGVRNPQETSTGEDRKASQRMIEERKDAQELSAEEAGRSQETSAGEGKKESEITAQERKRQQKTSAEDGEREPEIAVGDTKKMREITEERPLSVDRAVKTPGEKGESYAAKRTLTEEQSDETGMKPEVKTQEAKMPDTQESDAGNAVENVTDMQAPGSAETKEADIKETDVKETVKKRGRRRAAGAKETEEAEQKTRKPREKKNPENPKEKLSENIRKHIRIKVKDEELKGGSYKTIYNIFLSETAKNRFNTALVKAFGQEKGNRIYKKLLPEFEEHIKEQQE